MNDKMLKVIQGILVFHSFPFLPELKLMVLKMWTKVLFSDKKSFSSLD